VEDYSPMVCEGETGTDVAGGSKPFAHPKFLYSRFPFPFSPFFLRVVIS